MVGKVRVPTALILESSQEVFQIIESPGVKTLDLIVEYMFQLEAFI